MATPLPVSLPILDPAVVRPAFSVTNFQANAHGSQVFRQGPFASVARQELYIRLRHAFLVFFRGVGLIEAHLDNAHAGVSAYPNVALPPVLYNALRDLIRKFWIRYREAFPFVLSMQHCGENLMDGDHAIVWTNYQQQRKTRRILDNVARRIVDRFEAARMVVHGRTRSQTNLAVTSDNNQLFADLAGDLRLYIQVSQHFTSLAMNQVANRLRPLGYPV